MRHTIDSFIKFIQSELAEAAPTATLHVLRGDPNDPERRRLKIDAVNLYFLDTSYNTAVSSIQVSIDVIYNDEFSAISMRDVLWGILNKTYFITRYDYTVPSTPTKTTTSIYWDSKEIKFYTVDREEYIHFSCSLLLHTHVL